MKKKPTPKPKELPDIHFRLTDEEYRRLRAVAKALDRSVAYLVAQIVREWTEKHSGGES